MKATDAKLGRIIRLVERGAFKVGVIVGCSVTSSKLRVRIWSTNGRTWSKPQTFDLANVEQALMAEANSARERHVLKSALKSALAGGHLKVES